MAKQSSWQRFLDWLCKHYGIGCPKPKPPKRDIEADGGRITLKQKE